MCWIKHLNGSFLREYKKKNFMRHLLVSKHTIVICIRERQLQLDVEMICEYDVETNLHYAPYSN